MIFRTVVLLVVLLGLACAQPSLPNNIKDVLERIDGGMDKVLEIYNRVQQQEAKKFADLNIADTLSTFASLLTNAKSLVDQTAAALLTATNDLADAVLDLAAKIVKRATKTKILGDLITSFNDTRAAIMVECEVLTNFSAVAAVALKDAARAKLDLVLQEQRLLIRLAPAIVLDSSKAKALAADVADLRAKAAVFESLKTTIIPAFNDLNAKDIAKCLYTITNRTIELAYGIRNNFTTLKGIVGQTNITRRLADITAAVLAKSGVYVDATQIKFVYDNVVGTVSFVIQVKTGGIYVDQAMIVLRSALEAIANVRVTIIPDPAGWKVILQAAKMILPPKEDLKALFQKFEQRIDAAGSLYQQFKAELATITKEAIADAVTEIKKDIVATKATLQEAQAAYQQKVKDLAADVARAKALIYQEAKEAKAVVVNVLQAKKAQLESAISELKNHIEELKARIPELKEEIRKLQDKLIALELQIKVAAGNVLDDLKAQKDLLIDALRAKAGELQQLQDLVVSQGLEIVELLKKLEAEKIEIAQKIAKYAAGALDATVDTIQEIAKNKLEKVRDGLDTVAKFVVAGLEAVNATAYKILSNGVNISISVDFDSNSVSIDVIIPAIKAALQAEFGTDRISVDLVASVKRQSSSSAVLNSQVEPASPESPSGLSVGAIVGIAIGALVVVVAVVALAILSRRKVEEHDYSIM